MIVKAKEVLRKYYGYSSFRKGQEKIIDSILKGQDTFAIMPTGGGKSLCYQIPSLLMEGISIVISPLISLMKDQVDTLNRLGIKSAFINSSLSNRELNEVINNTILGKYKLLYIAPERLESRTFIETLKCLKISQIAIDEAHCVSQWGHDFRVSYKNIGPFIKKLDVRPIITAFTATATENVKEDIVKTLGLSNPNVYVTGFDRENLYLQVIKNENKKDFLLKYILDNKENIGIVYASTRKEVDSLYELLANKGYDVGKYHAGMNEEERKVNQDKFLYDDFKIIIATNAFGMGIDKSNVRYVIHYNMPKNMESYYQEAGRAGRDGEKSECILLFNPQDVMVQKYLIETTINNPERKNLEYRKLQEMVDYCHTSRCLRKYILEYFGEEVETKKCENCSNCKDEFELNDITIEAQKIFSCIYRMNQKFGVGMVADVLKGSKNKKVLNFNLDKLSTYGIIKEYTTKEIKDIINTLIADEYLVLTESQYPVVRLKQKAVNVIKGREKVRQKIAKRKAYVVQENTLFNELKSLRLEIAREEGVPPYIVFADTSLREMSEFLPENKEQMLNIKGVGENKFERYGERFIEIINRHTKTKKHIKSEQSDKVPSKVITFKMYKQGMTVDEIANLRNIKIRTIKDHLFDCAHEGYEINLDQFINEKYEEDILKKIKEIGCEKLRPIKEELPEEVEYDDIKAVICKYKLEKNIKEVN